MDVLKELEGIGAIGNTNGSKKIGKFRSKGDKILEEDVKLKMAALCAESARVFSEQIKIMENVRNAFLSFMLYLGVEDGEKISTEE
jgi:hypothetical protein